MQNHNNTIRRATQFLRKIYLSLYLKLVMCERELETDRTAISWPPLLWPSAFLSHSPGLLNQGPRGPASLGAGFLYHISNSSDPQNSVGGLRAPSAGFWLSLPYLVTNWSGLQNSLNFLCTELYNSSTPTQYLPITGHWNMHFRCLWNGMFDCHRAEITVMQFTGHSLPVHQFVTVPWDFNPVPHCQPSLPMPTEYATSASLEWHVWPGRRSIYYKSSCVSGHLHLLLLC